MGKATGFLEYERRTNPSRMPLERIRGFQEFHPLMEETERRVQGARCMNCGVPFCQSAMKLNGMVTGCPLHNLIPEWNDEVYHGNWQHALDRLMKTSSFPEFTGRVCPALCEAACTCGLGDEPVTVRENELAIIETGFARGLVRPQPPAVRTGKKVAVIGSGPCGLACADRLNRRGHEVTVFEREDRAGGLLMYGIPNMKLDKSVVRRRLDLMEAEGVIFRTSFDAALKRNASAILAEFDAVVLAAGAKKPRDMSVPGRKAKGIYFAVDFLKSTTKALLDRGNDGKLPESGYISAAGKNVVIIGGGDTGNDCVATCIRHGCRSVVQLEMMPKPPESRTADNPWPQWPRVLKTDYGQEEAIAVSGHDPRLFQTTVKEILSDDKGCVCAVRTVNLADQSEQLLDAELVLIAAGFLGAESSLARAFGVEQDERAGIRASEETYMTGRDRIFAAGDARRGQSLVVWAVREGREAARSVDQYLMGYTNMI
ncbi:MAG: glutamate synthase subunit beta [Emergencia sp.]